MRIYDLDRAMEQRMIELKCGSFFEDCSWDGAEAWQVEIERYCNQPYTYEEYLREQELIAEIGF